MEAHVKHEEVMFVGGKGKKGKKNRHHAQKQAEPANDKFAIDFHMINKFGLIRVSPPINADQLDPKIQEIKEKQEEFLREGEKELQKEKAEMLRNIEKQVDDELEKERRAQDEYGDEYEHEEEKKEEVKRP